jgi:hypothetical protein
MKEGRVKSAQEKASPSSGAQTMGLLQEWISDSVICRSAELFPESPVPETPAEPLRLRSRIARVIGETVMEPIARDVATVTVAREPKTEASNGKPTAAEFGNPRVSATTELSEALRFSRERVQTKLTAYKTA